MPNVVECMHWYNTPHVEENWVYKAFVITKKIECNLQTIVTYTLAVAVHTVHTFLELIDKRHHVEN